MYLQKNIDATKSLLFLAMSFAMSTPAIAQDIFDQSHALNVNLFDASTSLPIDDGVHYVEVDIIDNLSGISIGKESSQCMFVNGICSISVNENNLSVLENLKGVSFVVSVPGLIDENSISYDASNVSLSVKVPSSDGTIKYVAEPVLYARVAQLASNVTGDITPHSIDTSTLSINGSEVINESGEWVGNGAIQGEKGDTGSQGPKGDTGAQGPKGDTGAQGPKGDTGLRGVTGYKGDKGNTGPRGAIGPKGDRGYTGPRGATGPKGESGESGTVCKANVGHQSTTVWPNIPASTQFTDGPKAMNLEFIGRDGHAAKDFYIKLFLDAKYSEAEGFDQATLLESSVPGLNIESFSGGRFPSIKFNSKLSGLKFRLYPNGNGKNKSFSIVGTSPNAWIQGCFKSFSF